MVLSVTLAGGFEPDPVWSALGLLVGFERALSVRRLGPVPMLVALVVVIEVAYEMFRECFFTWSAWLHFRRVGWQWHQT